MPEYVCKTQSSLVKLMVGTRATRTLAGKMERARLEAQTLDELRQEALKYQLPISSDRTRLIETILQHFEQNTPLEEMLPATQRPRTQSARSRIGSIQAEQPGQLATVIPPTEIQTSHGSLDHIVETLNLCLEQQKHMMDEIRALSRRNISVPSEPPLERNTDEPMRSPAVSTASPAQAVTLLAPQIPEYGGTDEENIHIGSLPRTTETFGLRESIEWLKFTEHLETSFY